MEEKKIKESLEMIPELKTMFVGLKDEIKSLFTKSEPTQAEPTKEADPAPAKAEEPAKMEFNAEEFVKSYNEYKTGIEAKFAELEAKYSASEAKVAEISGIVEKQDTMLRKSVELIEKALEMPVAHSKQEKKDGAKKSTPAPMTQAELDEWRLKYSN